MNNRFRLVAGLALAAGLAWLAVPSASHDDAGIASAEAPPRANTPPLTPSPDLSAGDSTAAPSSVLAPSPERTTHSAYVTDQRMIRLGDPDTLDEVAHDSGLTVLRVAGASGYALVRGSAAQLSALASDDRVLFAAPNGVTRGAYDRGMLDVRGPHQEMQWHLPMVSWSDPYDWWENYFDYWSYRSRVVAVLDTGVAYETAVRDGVSYTQAGSLRSSPIFAPYDFVNDDPHANDDHQHGTHIASLIASQGVVRGVTPGAGLMPIKVLDETNQGTEFDLIEGIWHAIEHGAHVMNLSLSFHDAYQPSQALQEALQAAEDAGIYMVGAAGNGAGGRVTWPAASPFVLAVGATALPEEGLEPWGFDRYGTWEPAPYSNLGAGVDVMAPGGCIGQDMNQDGYADGLLAEAIDPEDPSRTGYWLMAGTSQAAAVVSGMAVASYSPGIPPSTWRHNAMSSAWVELGRTPWTRGEGAGLVGQIAASGQALGTTYASVLPYLSADEDAAMALVTVWNAQGEPMSGATAHVTVTGRDSHTTTCTTMNDGTCRVWGADLFDREGYDILAWSFSVDRIVSGRASAVPKAALAYTPQFDQAVRALRRDGERESMLAWHFTEASLPFDEVYESYSVVNSGSGLASIPLGVVMRPSLFSRLGTNITKTVRLEGNDVRLNVVSLDGSGLASIPLGLRSFRLVTLPASGWGLDGSGLASIPLGFTAEDAHSGGSLIDLEPQWSSMIPRGALRNQLGQQEWWANGFGGASVISSSDQTDLGRTSAIELDGMGAGAVELDW